MTIERLRLANNGLIEIHGEGPMCWYDDYEELQQSKNVLPPTRGTASQHSAWVSVKDALPEIGREVLVYRPKSERGTVTALARFIPYEGATDFCWDNSYPGKGNIHLASSITHWMPMPQPPQEVL